jgi:hypothetical protein
MRKKLWLLAAVALAAGFAPAPPPREGAVRGELRRASGGWAYITPNFEAHAPTAEAARRVGQEAERSRRLQALLWLGKELPAWPRPCPVSVRLTAGGAGGATSFTFDRGRILSMDMTTEGTLDRVLTSVLPHEVSHAVLAAHFRRPVPRWFDEGAAVMAECREERDRHDQLTRAILKTPGRAIPLRRLFAQKEYPRDVMVLFAEGYSLTRFLLEKKGRKTLLWFVEDGEKGGWDRAARIHYGYAGVDRLEEAWLKALSAK